MTTKEKIEQLSTYGNLLSVLVYMISYLNSEEEVIEFTRRANGTRKLMRERFNELRTESLTELEEDKLGELMKNMLLDEMLLGVIQ